MKIFCPACGAELTFNPFESVCKCNYCGNYIYVETGDSLKHRYFKPEIRTEQLNGILSRNFHERGLRGNFLIRSVELIFYSFWFIETKKRIYLFPACSTPYHILEQYRLEGGDMLYWEEREHPETPFEPPTQFLGTVLKKLGFSESDDPANEKPLNVEVLYVPFYKTEISFRDQVFTAFVSAHRGSVLWDVEPIPLFQKTDRVLKKELTRTFSMFFAVTFLSITIFHCFSCAIIGNLIVGNLLFRNNKNMIEQTEVQ